MKFRTLSAFLLIPLLSACLSTPVSVRGPVGPQSELLASGKTKVVTLLTFNDFHGTLEEDPLGKNVGAPKLAQQISDLRRSQPATLLLSAGDNYQGSALSNLTKGKVVSEFFQSVGLDASAVGNHEFDWGSGLFTSWSADGGFPFLAANIVEKASGDVPQWAKPYALFRVGGHLVAVLGLSTLDTLSSTKAENLADYQFLDPAATAKRWVNTLKATSKPELIIALTHIPSTMNLLSKGQAVSGSSANELDALSRVDGIDAIVTGHSHLLVNGTSRGVPVVQAYNYGRALGKITVTFKDDGTKKVSTSLDEVYKVKAELPEDAAVKALLDRYSDAFGAPLRERVAGVDAELAHFDEQNATQNQNLTPMGRWVCEVLRQKFHTQVAIMNGGGLRRGFPKGAVFVKDFWELMPFDNTAVTFEVSGAELKKILDHGIDPADFRAGQFSGVTVTYLPQGPYGKKIASLTLIDGTPVTDTGFYSVVTNDFVFGGGDKYDMIKSAARSATDTYLPIRDLLIDAARQAGTIKVPLADGLNARS